MIYIDLCYSDDDGDGITTVLKSGTDGSKLVVTSKEMPELIALLLREYPEHTAHNAKMERLQERVKELEAHSAAAFVSELHERYHKATDMEGFDANALYDIRNDIEEALLKEWGL